jgi:hypothetical protein
VRVINLLIPFFSENFYFRVVHISGGRKEWRIIQQRKPSYLRKKRCEVKSRMKSDEGKQRMVLLCCCLLVLFSFQLLCSFLSIFFHHKNFSFFFSVFFILFLRSQPKKTNDYDLIFTLFVRLLPSFSYLLFHFTSMH